MSNFKVPAFADLLAEQVLWQARAASPRQANGKCQTLKFKKLGFRIQD
jgi:hypothetical protein